MYTISDNVYQYFYMIWTVLNLKKRFTHTRSGLKHKSSCQQENPMLKSSRFTQKGRRSRLIVPLVIVGTARQDRSDCYYGLLLWADNSPESWKTYMGGRRSLYSEPGNWGCNSEENHCFRCLTRVPWLQHGLWMTEKLFWNSGSDIWRLNHLDWVSWCLMN